MSKQTILALLLATGLASAKTPDPDAGKYYTYDQLGIKKLEVVGSTIQLTFRTVPERFFWCPGINIKETPKAVIVTFVRCETHKTCPTAIPAKIGRKLIRTIAIGTKGKNTYIKNGPKQYKKIHSVEKKDETKKTIKKPSQPKKASSAKQPKKTGWIENELVGKAVGEK